MKRLIVATSILALLGLPAFAAADEDPYEKEDDTWISLDGTVESVQRDSFMLDYGEGVIDVEMDDGDRDADAYKLRRGDKVRVSGIIDDDFFETTTIEASSVYVENLGTYFYASSVDEEDRYKLTNTDAVEVSETEIEGIVTNVQPEAEQFTLDTGRREFQVEVDEMPYNPLDDEGYQKIEIADRVLVSGDVDLEFFDEEAERDFVADSVITLSD